MDACRSLLHMSLMCVCVGKNKAHLNAAFLPKACSAAKRFMAVQVHNARCTGTAHQKRLPEQPQPLQFHARCAALLHFSTRYNWARAKASAAQHKETEGKSNKAAEERSHRNRRQVLHGSVSNGTSKSRRAEHPHVQISDSLLTQPQPGVPPPCLCWSMWYMGGDSGGGVTIYIAATAGKSAVAAPMPQQTNTSPPVC